MNVRIGLVQAQLDQARRYVFVVVRAFKHVVVCQCFPIFVSATRFACIVHVGAVSSSTKTMTTQMIVSRGAEKVISDPASVKFRKSCVGFLSQSSPVFFVLFPSIFLPSE